MLGLSLSFLMLDRIPMHMEPDFLFVLTGTQANDMVDSYDDVSWLS